MLGPKHFFEKLFERRRAQRSVGRRSPPPHSFSSTKIAGPKREGVYAAGECSFRMGILRWSYSIISPCSEKPEQMLPLSCYQEQPWA
jgi:hypothetical protein